MTTTLDLINAIESGRTRDCERTFADLVQEKVAAAIALRADDVRASMFESADVDEAVRVMSTNPATGGMTRFPKNHPAGAAAQAHRDATAKAVKQVRASGATLRKDSTVRVDGKTSVMKYASKDVQKESTELDESAMPTKDLEAMHALHSYNAEKHSDAGVRKSSAETASKIAGILKQRYADKAAKAVDKFSKAG